MVQMLRKRLAAGEPTVGSWISIGHPSIAEILARAGFDWLVIDLEHSVIGTETAGELIRTIALCGVPPLVRLTSNNADQIKRMMDAGAQGIVVPNVNSAAEAAAAVSATRYAPLGNRGVGLGRAQGYGTGFQDYLAWQSEGPVVIAMIEHKNSVARIDEILAVPGVDGLLIGPYDLSCSMGLPGQTEHPDVTATMTRILEAARLAGRPAGLHIVEPDPQRLQKTLQQGYKFVAYSVDMRLLDVAARAGVLTNAGRPDKRSE